MNDNERKLRNARAQVVQSHPFFGALLLRQQLVETHDVATLATNGKELFYNPDFVAQSEMDHLHFACAHEALHPGLLHHTRRGDREFELWNMACDYAINPILADAKFHLPEGVLLRDDLRALNAETIYARLLAERPPPPPEPEPETSDDDGDGQGDPQGSPDDQGDDDGQGVDSDDDDGQGNAPGDDTEGEGASDDDDGQGDPSDGQSTGDDTDPPSGGSPKAGAQGTPGDAPGQGQIPSFGGAGAVLDAPTPDEPSRQREESDWKVLVSQAEAMAEPGTVPGDLIRELRALLEPRADWRELLRRYMDQFSRSDYSWRSPNRRMIAAGHYLPSMRSEQMGPIAFVIDASASMRPEALTQACSELQAIASDLHPSRIDVIVHDTMIRHVETFETDEPIEITVVAGGGTLFAPTCAYLNALDEPPAVILWFTDMEPGDWDAAGREAPDSPVLWLDYANGYTNGRSADAATFGDDVVEMRP